MIGVHVFQDIGFGLGDRRRCPGVRRDVGAFQPARLGAAADKMAADPKGFDKHFIPEDKRVLWATKLLQPGQTAELSFIAPKSGAYPYICTFPLHWKLMNGVMHVVQEEAAKK